MSTAAPSLQGKTILLVEDDYFLMNALRSSLETEGAKIIGPAPSVERALALATTVPQLDAAVLDINLQDKTVFPVADALRAREVPFLFTTGYDEAAIPAHLRDVVRREKPSRLKDVVEILSELLKRNSPK